LPPAAARWTGLAKYNFTGGNNDAGPGSGRRPDRGREPLAAARGRNLATYNLAHGPQGYRPLREFLVAKLERDAGIACTPTTS
jgi:2-aminoadipate transaminase